MPEAAPSKGPLPLLQDPQAHPAALTVLLSQKFGTAWLDWEPDVLWFEITQDISRISEINRNRVQAVRTLLLTDGFWRAWEIFVPVALALNGTIPSFKTLQVPSLGEMMSAVEAAEIIRPQHPGFSEDVTRFIAASALEAGVWFLPAPLDFAQERVSQPMYRCKTCGDVGEYTAENRCVHCTGAYSPDLTEHALSGRVAPGISTTAGMNLDLFLTHDPEPLAVRLKQVSEDPSVELQETPEDIAAHRILAAIGYATLQKLRLQEQSSRVLT